MDPISLARSLYTITAGIYTQVKQVQINQQQCQILADRVQLIEQAIRKLKSLPNTKEFCDTLTKLSNILTEILGYMKKLSDDNWFRQFLMVNDHNRAIKKFNEDLKFLIPLLNLGLDTQMLMNQETDQKAIQKDQQLLLAKQDEILRLNEAMFKKLNQAPDQKFFERQQQSVRLKLEQVMQMMRKIQEQKLPVSPASPLTPKKEELTLDSKIIIPYFALELKEFLGQGTFGKVYRGLWQETPVVIKMWEGILSDKEQQQFIREVQVLQHLRTPIYIPQLYAVCLEGHQACLVMEYCPLGSLDQYLKSNRPSSQQQQQLAISIAKALKFLHDNRVVHRYFKSANVLLIDGGNGVLQAKITGFGLSKTQYPSIVSAQLAIADLMTGLAPELLAGKEATMAADVFSFGSVLWELLTGKKAFTEVTPEQFHKGYQEDCRQIPSGYAALIKACWNIDPLKRPQFAEIITTLTELPASATLSPGKLEKGKDVFASLGQPKASPTLFSSPAKVSAISAPADSGGRGSNAYNLAKKYHEEGKRGEAKKYELARQQYEIVISGNAGEIPANITKARTKLATLLIRGNGGKQAELKTDQTRAIQLFEQSAAEDDIIALQNLEKAYRQGIGADKNERIANDYRERYQALSLQASASLSEHDSEFHSVQVGSPSLLMNLSKPTTAVKPSGKPTENSENLKFE